MNKIVLIAIIALTTTQLCAQVTPRVAGLEKNVEYMSLLQKEHDLQIREDSVVNLVTKTRNAFKTNTEDRAKNGADILRLEGELFDIRNEIGMMESKINDIEQEFVINNLDKYIKPTEPAKTTEKRENTDIKSANIAHNSYFRNNLAEKDYNALVIAQNKETAIKNYLKIYTNNYASMQQIEQQYQSAEKAHAADSLYSKYRLLGALNDKISDSISSIWSYISDNKSYVYSYLFDKMNQSATLANYENETAKVRQMSAEMQGRYASDIVAIYPSAKKILLNYELALTEAVGLTQAADSLKTALTKIDTLKLDLPKIEITERIFIDYKDISIAARSPYSTANPIPKCVVYPRGVVYRILLGSYTKAQVPSIFRGVSPIGYLVDPDKRYNYYAGGHQTMDQAETGVDKLKKVGFKRPEIVVWENGSLSNVSQESAASVSSVQKNASVTALYRIEVKSTESDLPDVIKQIIKEQGSSVDISRIVNSLPAEFEYTFIIGTFDSHSTATRLAKTISDQELGLKVDVAQIAN